MPILDAYATVLSGPARLAGERCAVRVFGARQRNPAESVRLTQEELAAIVATTVDAVLQHIEERAVLLAAPAASGRVS